MDEAEPILENEKHFGYRLFFYALIFAMVFFGVAAALEECGYETNLNFGWDPARVRRLYLILSTLGLPFVILLPDLGFRLYLDRSTGTLRVLHLYLFWTRARDVPLGGMARLVSRRGVWALRVFYLVALRSESGRELPLFTLGRQDVEENGLDRELARKLNLPYERG